MDKIVFQVDAALHRIEQFKEDSVWLNHQGKRFVYLLGVELLQITYVLLDFWVTLWKVKLKITPIVLPLLYDKRPGQVHKVAFRIFISGLFTQASTIQTLTSFIAPSSKRLVINAIQVHL